jgi:nicotinate phosphoribosyltransferase
MGVSEAPVRPAISMAGSWKDVTYWETLMLPILNELFYRTIMEDMPAVELDIMYARAKDKLYRKLIEIKQRPHIRIADFGLRRRHSHLWQKYAIEMAQEVLGEQFTGTSNTWMAWNRDLVPIGTNAHELPMVLTALADTKEEKIDAQYEVLRKWETLFPMGGLRIVLPDTYGTGQFLRNMPKDLAERVAHEWRGFRLDSGNPMDEARRIIIWYQRMGVDPWRSEKVVIPSDGLDVESILAIDDVLNEIIHHPYGWGTMFTNDFRGCHPRADEHAVVGGKRLNLTWDELFSGHSFVCKVTRARKSRSDEWRGAVKLSNNPRKATGTQQDIAEYLKTFGDGGREDSAVFV